MRYDALDPATEVDPAVVEMEKRSLKNAFCYIDFSRDVWWLLDDAERAIFAAANRAGYGLYAVAARFVEDCYFERGALEPLVKIYSARKYQFASEFDRLLEHLLEAQRFDLIERLWTSVARRTRAEFFYQRPGRDHGAQSRVDQAKSFALEAYAQGIDWMTRLGRLDAAAQLTEESDALREERFPSLPAPSDLRRIDEPVFWELISKARSQAQTTLEQLTILGELLRSFRPAEIRRFCLLYAKIMKKLYHWDVWALAYAARGGCSDASFEGFRTWVILQGDPALVELVIAKPAQAAERVPPDPDIPEAHCLLMIEEAYLQRAGSSLEIPSIDLDKPKGKEWTEELFAATYPQLVRHYASETKL